jgi:hypothetical protein
MDCAEIFISLYEIYFVIKMVISLILPMNYLLNEKYRIMPFKEGNVLMSAIQVKIITWIYQWNQEMYWQYYAGIFGKWIYKHSIIDSENRIYNLEIVNDEKCMIYYENNKIEYETAFGDFAINSILGKLNA